MPQFDRPAISSLTHSLSHSLNHPIFNQSINYSLIPLDQFTKYGRYVRGLCQGKHIPRTQVLLGFERTIWRFAGQCSNRCAIVTPLIYRRKKHKDTQQKHNNPCYDLDLIDIDAGSFNWLMMTILTMIQRKRERERERERGQSFGRRTIYFLASFSNNCRRIATVVPGDNSGWWPIIFWHHIDLVPDPLGHRTVAVFQ